MDTKKFNSSKRPCTAARNEFKYNYENLLREEVKQWLEDIFQRTLGDDNYFYENLKTGTLLCQLLEKLDPELKIKYNSRAAIPASCRDNIQVFLDICSLWNIKSSFLINDLYDYKSFGKVISCICELGLKFSKDGFTPALCVTPFSVPMKKSDSLRSTLELTKQKRPSTTDVQIKCSDENYKDSDNTNDTTNDSTNDINDEDSNDSNITTSDINDEDSNNTNESINKEINNIKEDGDDNSSIENLTIDLESMKESNSTNETPKKRKKKVRRKKSDKSPKAKAKKSKKEIAKENRRKKWGLVNPNAKLGDTTPRNTFFGSSRMLTIEDESDESYDESYDSEDSLSPRLENDRRRTLYNTVADSTDENTDEKDIESNNKENNKDSETNIQNKIDNETYIQNKDNENIKDEIDIQDKDNENKDINDSEKDNKNNIQDETDIQDENESINIELSSDSTIEIIYNNDNKNDIITENKKDDTNIDNKEITNSQGSTFDETTKYYSFDYDIPNNIETVPVEQYNSLLAQYKVLQTQFLLQAEELEELKDIIAATSIKKVKKIKKSKSLRKKTLRDSDIKTEEQIEEHKRILELKEQKRKEQELKRRQQLTDKRKLQRLSVLEEILYTEKNYLTSLQVLVHCKTLLLDEKAISPQEAEDIFSNIEELLNYHQAIAKALETRFQALDDGECWSVSTGDIFIRVADLLKKYTPYVDNQTKQNKVVGLCGQRKIFVNTLSSKLLEFEEKDLVIVQFNSYLIAPIQRMCKYPLLLRELIRFTDDDHEDKIYLDTAINRIEIAAMEVNQRKKEFESYVKILEINHCLENTPKSFSVFKEGRLFIREGLLSKISKGKTQERHFYLFNDIIVYGSKAVIKTGKIVFKGRIYLNRVLVNDIPDSDIQKNAFELVRIDHKKKKYIICAKDYAQKKLWINDIQDRVIHYLEEARYIEEAKSAIRIPDEELLYKERLKFVEEVSKKLTILKEQTKDIHPDKLNAHLDKIRKLEGDLNELSDKLTKDKISV